MLNYLYPEWKVANLRKRYEKFTTAVMSTAIFLIAGIGSYCITPALSYSAEPIVPIPRTIDYEKEKAELGKKLFFDRILSRDNSISCSSCHDLYKGELTIEVLLLVFKGKGGACMFPPY
jgi:hypothetical protein